MVWLSTNFLAQTGGDTDSVRVVTSRSRARDGGPDAARKLVHTLRHTLVGARLQVLIFCHDWREVKDLTDKTTSASSDPIALRTFCSW